MSPRRKLRARLRSLLAGGVRYPGYTPSWLARQAAAAAGLGLGAAALVAAILLLNRQYLQFGQLWLLLTAGFLILWTIRPLRRPPPPSPLPAGDPIDHYRDRPYPLADRWERRLSLTSGDPEWYGRVVRDRLAALVAERFRQRYGTTAASGRSASGARGQAAGPSLTAAAGPDRLRAALGDELHDFLTAPLARTPSPEELDRLITRIEEM